MCPDADYIALWGDHNPLIAEVVPCELSESLVSNSKAYGNVTCKTSEQTAEVWSSSDFSVQTKKITQLFNWPSWWGLGFDSWLGADDSMFSFENYLIYVAQDRQKATL